MRNKAILFSLMLVATHPVLAEQTLLEGVAKQVVKDTVKEAVPVEVKKAAETATQTLDKAKAAPAAHQEVAKEAVPVEVKKAAETATQTLDKAKAAPAALQEVAKEAVPVEVKKAAETVKTDKVATENLKAKAEHAPKAIKSKVKQKTTEKALKPIR